jgi:beta-phosphoglucomutase-like phosphatase (HAD superfamily)
LKKLNTAPAETIAFEDSEAGFQAARAAGLTVYGIKHDFNKTHSFELCAGTITSFDECLTWDLFRK